MARKTYSNGRTLDQNSATNTHPEAMDPRDLDTNVHEAPVTRLPKPEGDRPQTTEGHDMRLYREDEAAKSGDIQAGSLGDVADIQGERGMVAVENTAERMAEEGEVNEAAALREHGRRHKERCATEMSAEVRLSLQRRAGESLEQYETRLAEQRVHQDDHETAKRADILGTRRAESSRATLAAEDHVDTVTVDGQDDEMGVTLSFDDRAESVGERYTPMAEIERGETWTDPRETLAAEELAELNQAAAEVADEVPGHSRIELAIRGARRIQQGADPRWAVIEAMRALKDGADGIRALETVEPWMAGYTMTVDVEVTIERLYNPMSDSQYQVAEVTDPTIQGTRKFTIWQESVKYRQTGEHYTLGTDRECDNTIPRLREEGLEISADVVANNGHLPRRRTGLF